MDDAARNAPPFCWVAQTTRGPADALIRTSPALDAPKTFIQGTAAAHLGKEPAGAAGPVPSAQGRAFFSFRS
jgi:hypothetical protein